MKKKIIIILMTITFPLWILPAAIVFVIGLLGFLTYEGCQELYEIIVEGKPVNPNRCRK